MLGRSFWKKNPSKHPRVDEASTDCVHKLTNYCEAVQVAKDLKAENRQLRINIECLKQQQQQKQQQQLQQQQQQHQQFILELEQQQQHISKLEASLIETQQHQQQSQENEVQQQKRIFELEASLKEAHKDLSEKDGEEKKAIFDATLRKQLPSVMEDKWIEILSKQCAVLEEKLANEMRDHSALQMKINKENTDIIVKGQTMIVNQMQETDDKTSSALTKLLMLAEDEKTRSHTNFEKCPPHLFGFALRVQNEMEDNDKVKNLGTSLGLCPDRVGQLASESNGDPKELFWKVFYEWTSEPQCLADLISTCHKVGICKDDSMSLPHRKAIEQTYTKLESDIFVSVVVSQLREYAVLSDRDVNYIISPKLRREQFRRLIDTMPLFGEKTFDYFVTALEQSGQKHLATMLLDELQTVDETKDPSNLPIRVFKTTEADNLNDKDIIVRLLATLLTETREFFNIIIERR